MIRNPQTSPPGPGNPIKGLLYGLALSAPIWALLWVMWRWMR